MCKVNLCSPYSILSENETLGVVFKNIEKSLKNVLTSLISCGIIAKHSQEKNISCERKGPWKLNNDEKKEPDKIQKSFICTT